MMRGKWAARVGAQPPPKQENRKRIKTTSRRFQACGKFSFRGQQNLLRPEVDDLAVGQHGAVEAVLVPGAAGGVLDAGCGGDAAVEGRVGKARILVEQPDGIRARAALVDLDREAGAVAGPAEVGNVAPLDGEDAVGRRARDAGEDLPA